MTGPSPFDENCNGASDVCLDDFLNFFDFPLEDVEENVGGGEYWDAHLQLIEPLPNFDVLPGFSSGKICDDASNAPFDKSSHPKELPSTTEATSSGSVLHSNTSDVKVSQLFQTSSPISVLESSSSCSVENPTTFDVKFISPVKRPRSKRSRPSTFHQRFMIPFISSTSSPPERSHSSTTSESGSEIHLTETVSNPVKRKQKKKKNLSVLSGATEVGNFTSEGLGITRKCMHCEVTKTPQWREGPMGPKTLCNACGVRYRSGRLFPEYRPASSPSFVASLHSNSHKKVIEIRNKASPGGRMVTMESLWPPLRVRGESIG